VGALSPAGAAPGERIAFLTGKLAEPSLRSLLAPLAAERGFEAEVVVLNIAVAALMTADWAARRLALPSGISRLVVPGYLTGELRALEAAAGAPCVRGPKDLRELPRFLGSEAAVETGRGPYAIEIIAEINHVPRLTRDEVLAAARALRGDGADVIDLGCDPGGPFPGIGDLVQALRAEGLRVSVDSLDPAEIAPAVRAGAELVLSVNGSNVDAVRDLGCEVVAIPDEPSSLAGLDATLAKLEDRRVKYRIDPVLEPIGFGFARSLGRYITVRDRYPRAEILCGVGNITELTDADTAPINVLLLGFCEELGIRSVLTTQVIHWARTCVRELDLARRLVHRAVTQKRLPKHLEPDLHLLRDAAVLEHGQETLDRLAAALRDGNFRLFAERGAIHVLAAGLQVEGTDPFALFARLGVSDAAHAFYLGYEMAKAVTALTLGKSYVQDEALRWGFLTAEEKSHLARRAAEGETKHGQ
jgi:dihydropteroate synthase-like protein